MRIRVDGSRIRNNKVAFSNLSGIVWTGPQFKSRQCSSYFKCVKYECAEMYIDLIFSRKNLVCRFYLKGNLKLSIDLQYC